MECQDYREQFSLMLSGTLDEMQRSELESHLSACEECSKEFAVSQKIWNLMGELPQPEPSDAMRTGFKAILNNYKEEMYADKNPLAGWINKLREQWYLQARPRFAFGLILILLGLTGGYFLHRPGQTAISYNKQIDSLSSQVSDMKQLMMLSLLQNPSASQRIRAVGYTEEIGNVDNKVIDALLTTLNEDPNVNVRLITLEALVKLSNEPKVREGLVRSISLQESPLVQSAIADAMVKLQEKSSVQSLQKLLGKKDLNQMVKLKIQESIHKLI
jgi:HEAT repeats/Putative zinc-finger